MKKKKLVLLSCILSITAISLFAQETISDSLFPVRGFCIAAPEPSDLDEFIRFIQDDLAPRSINTLILRVDFGYQYTSHPELKDEIALSDKEVKKIVNACRKHDIRLIPQINLLGHQSWAGKVNKLLQVYPEFDETPHVKMPENYQWPNADGLYCKSYCPLHPGVHAVVFDLVDEICAVFEADAFHAGMDEVFYIGSDSCERCQGRDKAELFAGEVTAIRNHLARKNRQLWIWGDRLIDGKTTGMGMWEASYNTTYKAVDLIPKDVMICDWHYERADQTPVYFAMKGFHVVTCPWNMPEVAVQQADDMLRFRQQSAPEMKDRFAGMVQTVWSSTGQFLKEYRELNHPDQENKNNSGACFRALFDHLSSLQKVE
ncbi:MAG: family 20 glycosylhydrolase [Bacteroidales bacterium]|nr:family 20 glycosylhydrolase [Bacteroidales bacterium]